TSGVFSLYMLICALALVLGGWALDRYGPRVVLATMALFTSGGLLLTSRADSLWHLFVSYSLLIALGTGGYWIVTIATAAKWFPQKRGLATGIVNMGNGVGMMVMTPLAAYTIGAYGWRDSYVILAVIAFVILGTGTLVLRPTSGAEITASASTAASTDKPAPPKTPDFSLLQAARTRNFWLLFSMMFLFALCVFAILTHLVPHALDLGNSPLESAALLSVIGATSALGGLAAGRMADRIGSKQTSVICCLMVAVAMLWLVPSRALWMLYVFAAVFGFFYGGLLPAGAALLGDLFGLRNYGLLLGVRNVAWAVGAAIGPALAGYVFDVNRSYVADFWVGMVAMMMAGGLIMLTRKPARPQ
ncbi:MAG: MFS transporter, partial [Chloroflexota bacterium]